MIYDGTNVHANGKNNVDRFALKSVAWNTPNYDDAKYVGYMYSGSNGTASTSKSQAQTNQTNSNVKTQIDTWSKENIVDTGYNKYVSDEIFCNDRTIPGSSVSNWTSDTGLGYAKNATAYGAYGRFLTGNNGTSTSRRSNPSPKFTCSQKNDAFTVSDTTKGNGALTYPVGLITADEIIASGGSWGTINRSYYLYKGPWYWSLSPCFMNANSYARVFVVNSDGGMSAGNVNYAVGDVAPVINISPEASATLSGTGTMTDPFEIQES